MVLRPISEFTQITTHNGWLSKCRGEKNFACDEDGWWARNKFRKNAFRKDTAGMDGWMVYDSF